MYINWHLTSVDRSVCVCVCMRVKGGVEAAESCNLLLSITVVSRVYPYSSMIQ